MLTEGFCCTFLKEIPLWNLEKYVGPSKVGMENGETSCVIGNWDISAKRETPPWILSPSPQVHWSKAEGNITVSEKYCEDVMYEKATHCQNKSLILVDLGQIPRRL